VRSAVLLTALACTAAVAVAFVSRTPAELRNDKPGPEATDPSRGPSFSDAEIQRHAAYRGPGYLSFALGLLMEVAFLVVLAQGGMDALARATDRLPGPWPVQAAALGMALVVLNALLVLPLDYVRGFAIAHAWGLSTQDVGGWASDRLRSAAVGAVTSAVAAVAFFAVVRWQPRTWWLWGWGAFTLLTVVLVFLYPVVIAPLFNKFTPLEDRSLVERVQGLAGRSGVEIEDVLVADASRRTTAENAYVAGFGSSKRLVLYDTLVASGSEDETALVVAHELGHRIEKHIWKNLLLSAASLFVGFGVLAWLSDRSWAWEWAGASGVSDLRAIPVLLLFAMTAQLLTLPLENSISRRFEARADSIAVELTEDPRTAVRVWRRLAYSNIADLKPPEWLVWSLYTHPPVSQRIRAALAQAAHEP
jgi:STE24 endopeptidase